MTNKLVVIINSLKIPKTKNILLYEMKFLVPNYSRLQNPCLGGYRPQIPVLSVLCPQLNLLNPPPEQNSWVRHWLPYFFGLNSSRNSLHFCFKQSCIFNIYSSTEPFSVFLYTLFFLSLACHICTRCLSNSIHIHELYKFTSISIFSH